MDKEFSLVIGERKKINKDQISIRKEAPSIKVRYS